MEKAVWDVFQRQSGNARLRVAADGGLAWFHSLHLPPDFLVGDMDSVRAEHFDWAVQGGCVPLVASRRKDELDAELAVNLCANAGVKVLSLFGVWGDRADQSLACIPLLDRCMRSGMDAQVQTGEFCMGMLRGPVTRAFETTVGRRWSFVVLSESAEQLELRGFEYPLQNAQVAFYQAKLLSNSALQPRVEVGLGQGHMLYMEFWE
ncbi:MAG TPA: thiamine diphosphokinase [Thermotogota bacterium]|nr:thiamine diphosphokinase [Thermotogota bacterium]HRW92832.1 thiamine diphosphokinase [Thermotogota bacterium]